MKHSLPLLSVAVLSAFVCRADIYTAPDPGSPGGLAAVCSANITLAVLVNETRKEVYQCAPANGTALRFTGIPVGKYHLVLVAEPPTPGGVGQIYSGVPLGGPVGELSKDLQQKLDQRIDKNDAFFPRYHLHDIGWLEEGAIALAVIERIKEGDLVLFNGKDMPFYLRRVELATLELATDDWKINSTRHIYRGEIPEVPTAWMDYQHIPALGKIRITDSVKDLGTLELPAPPVPEKKPE